MASFECPQCYVKVNKDPGEKASGCPCCGYAKDIQGISPPAPYFPWWGIYPPWGQEEVKPIELVEPYNPWVFPVVSPNTADPRYNKTITSDNTSDIVWGSETSTCCMKGM